MQPQKTSNPCNEGLGITSMVEAIVGSSPGHDSMSTPTELMELFLEDHKVVDAIAEKPVSNILEVDTQQHEVCVSDKASKGSVSTKNALILPVQPPSEPMLVIDQANAHIQSAFESEDTTSSKYHDYVIHQNAQPNITNVQFVHRADDYAPANSTSTSFDSFTGKTQDLGVELTYGQSQESMLPVTEDQASIADYQVIPDVVVQNSTTDLSEQQLVEMQPGLREQIKQAIEHYMPETPPSVATTSSVSAFQSSVSPGVNSGLGVDASINAQTLLTVSATHPLAAVLSGPEALKTLRARESGEGEDEVEVRCHCGNGIVGKDACYYCWPCNGVIYCDSCWSIAPPHTDRPRRANFMNPSGEKVVHEKSDPISARKIVEALRSDHSLEHQAMLHTADEDTTWFGTGRDPETGDTVFQDFGRYSRLMAESSRADLPLRYPALVSFVGQTGAGESSLIRLLVELHSLTETNPQVPVIGSTQRADLPTSGDVHLYADPNTSRTEQPILYADCEGLDGGEREPSGARIKSKKTLTEFTTRRTNSFARNIRRLHHTSEREILWATDNLTKSREYHVRHLYPRLLYTFSDVIVFVIKNPRVVESVIEQLLRWAADALETSSNQPVLPHAIIVLNAYDNASDPDLWEPGHSTTSLMASVSRAVHRNHNIRKFAEFWRQKGREIESVETLLLSYYSSNRVVRVPERGRPNLINGQVQRLYQEISDACEESRTSKHKLRMLLNSDDL